jgi:hypothetical protein
MEKKWEFDLTLFVESKDQPADHTTFHEEHSTIEITDLSEKREKPTDSYGTKLGEDWSTVENPMELQKYLESMGDHKTLSFRAVWDGGAAADVLRSVAGTVLPKAELRVFQGTGSSLEIGKKEFHTKPIVSVTLAPAHIQFVGYEPFIGGERFAVRFGHLRSEFN